jgi:hypothetical protein
MKLRVISARNEISNLNPNEKFVHMAYRASNLDYLALIKGSPKLRMIQVPPSYHRTMSNTVRTFLNLQGIELLEGDVWGHRKDLDDYFTIGSATMEEINSLAESGKTLDEVADKVRMNAKIPPDLIKYVATNKIRV